MYGVNMYVAFDGLGVKLRPFSKGDLPVLVRYFSSMKVHMYTQGLFAQTEESEEEWYERTRKDERSCTWAIQPDGSEEPIGITSLHGIDLFGSASSGIIIWNVDWWGKGIATRAHLGRTLFAADYLNRLTIKSSVRADNAASFRALTRVGYNLTGLEPRTSYRAGRYIDTKLLCWIHPEKINLLFPEGGAEAYKEGIENASIALLRARQFVNFP